MKNIIKTVSLLTIISVIPAAFAATASTSRISVSTKASPRLPSIAGHIVAATSSTSPRSNTTTSTTAAYYGDSDCIEKYTDCIKADDVCGSDFQECTTNVLFHGQMPKCASVLYQCSSTGVNALFGTSAINALSTVYAYKPIEKPGEAQEVDRYTYPTDGSVMGQLIIGANITNQLTTEQCTRRYTNCLKRDDICGSDFELCTDGRAFKKQAMLCDSTLQRCQNEGRAQLFGSVANSKDLKPATDSRLGQLIEEGASLAALNAVKTCQKVTDNCLISACLKNPLRCVEGISTATIGAADFVTGGNELSGSTSTTQSIGGTDYQANYLENQTGSEIRKMLKAQCLETIGTNKYCHMTYREIAPSNKDLVDIDLQEDVFSLAYSARKDAVNTKIQEEVKKFDTDAKNRCFDTIKSCVMRSCGGGLGSVCYEQAMIDYAPGVHVNGQNTYSDIASGCSAIVNADANCIYAATSAEPDGYQYTYTNNTTFDTLFPQYTGSEPDVIGAVGKLNSILATSYNDAAIEDMKKQCQTVALSCVKSMCGKDYINCYRNRTDIIISGDGSYDTGVGRFDKSMNKMGGVIDYNIVMGLCMNTVKTASVCEEHLKIAAADWRNSQYKDSESWGSNTTTVRDAWLGANTVTSPNADVLVACAVSEANAALNDNCTKGATMPPKGDGNKKSCVGVMDNDGCLYSEPIYQLYSEYTLENSATTLFQQLLVDVEKEAQANYNAKLTKEQNICLANNGGGVMGNADTGSTFMWVKLKSNKVPKNYENNGLTTKQFVASNDLYGSFCRAKITVLSDDKDIQELLGNRATAYFAVGDSFTCGSWIKESELRRISDMVGERELCKQGYGKWINGKCDGSKLSTKEKVSYIWGTVAPALAGAGIGVGLTESGLVSKWHGLANQKNDTSFAYYKNLCISMANSAISALSDQNGKAIAKSYLDQAHTACQKVYSINNSGINCPDVPDEKSGYSAAAYAYKSACSNVSYYDGVTTHNHAGTRIAVPIASAVAAGGAGAGITASVIKTKRENIQNEAAQRWMDEIGEHIQCYLGADELGSYGDVVSIELD